MAIQTGYSRLLLKRASSTGVEPTVATYSPTIIDETWLATDILPGEMFLNLTDDRLWARTDNGILELVTTSTYSSTDIWENTGTSIQLSATYSGFPVLPATDDTSDLGSATYRFKDLYLGSTLDVASYLTYSVAGTEIYKYDINGIELQDGKVISEVSSGGELDLRSGNDDTLLLSNDSGAYGRCYLYMGRGFATSDFVELSNYDTSGPGGTIYSYSVQSTTFDTLGSFAISGNDIQLSSDTLNFDIDGEEVFTSDIATMSTSLVDKNAVIISARNSSVNASVTNGGIFGGISNTMGNNCDRTVLIGGSSNDALASASMGAIIGGSGHTLNASSRTVIIGGSSITGALSDAVYVSDLVITKNHSIPTSTADTDGDTGSITWDASYIYIKTSGGIGAGGWKRVALSTF